MFPKMFHTEYDWDYNTVEQPGLSSRTLFWPRGRMLGGCTSLNAMMYHHCSKSDFEEWKNLHGCEGWGYDDLAPYLRRMEKFTPNTSRPAIEPENRGSSGKLETGYSWLSEITEDGFLPGCHDAGIPPNADINTKDGSMGVTRFQTFIDQKGERSSMATAFLTQEVLDRPNLSVAVHAQVTRVLFDTTTSKTPTTIGVELKKGRGGEPFQVHARREVILSGGSVNTPQTLLLSGIGPRDELESLGVPVLQEIDAVGKNMKDHLCPTPMIVKADPSKTLDYLGTTAKAIPALLRWKLFGSGPLTSNAGEAAAFIRSTDYNFPASTSPPTDVTSGPASPDLEIIGVPLAFVNHGEEPIIDGSSVFTIICCHLRPMSAGTISLKSRDPFEPRKFTTYNCIDSRRSNKFLL